MQIMRYGLTMHSKDYCETFKKGGKYFRTNIGISNVVFIKNHSRPLIVSCIAQNFATVKVECFDHS